jgi:hypothetical protein
MWLAIESMLIVDAQGATGSQPDSDCVAGVVLHLVGVCQLYYMCRVPAPCVVVGHSQTPSTGLPAQEVCAGHISSVTHLMLHLMLHPALYRWSLA